MEEFDCSTEHPEHNDFTEEEIKNYFDEEENEECSCDVSMFSGLVYKCKSDGNGGKIKRMETNPDLSVEKHHKYQTIEDCIDEVTTMCRINRELFTRKFCLLDDA